MEEAVTSVAHHFCISLHTDNQFNMKFKCILVYATIHKISTLDLWSGLHVCLTMKKSEIKLKISMPITWNATCACRDSMFTTFSLTFAIVH